MSAWFRKWFARESGLKILLEDHLRGVDSPANLRINDQIREYREFCRRMGCTRPYHHFAFGQSPFPPPPPVVEALAVHAGRHDYLPTAGLPQLREAIVAFYRHHFGIETDAARVVISPGSKEMIAMILGVLQGPVLIPTPSWVSYLPQAKILKKRVISLRTREVNDHKLTADLLDHHLKGEPTHQKILILNHPNNPTGVVYSAAELGALAEVCRRHNVVVISDEIYALTSFEPDGFTSMGVVYPEGTILTGGMSKDRSAGGYRLGVGVFPNEPQELTEDILKLAGSTYSCVAAPIQHAALTAYSLDDAVEGYMRDCSRFNAAVGAWFAGLMEAIPGVRTTTPHGGFYLFVDFNEFGAEFRRHGMPTCAEFAADVLKVEHTAMLPGVALLLSEDDFSVRCSFVDYDGPAALAAWRSAPPQTPERHEDFLRRHCPLLAEGVAALSRYFGQIRSGKRPEHTI
jgi:aspartate aminotransferase